MTTAWTVVWATVLGSWAAFEAAGLLTKGHTGTFSAFVERVTGGHRHRWVFGPILVAASVVLAWHFWFS